MKEHPILFSGEMVCAILEGRKTQTRRVLKPQPPSWVRWLERGDFGGIPYYGSQVETDNCGREKDWRVHLSDCPYGTKGGRLWVREKLEIQGVNWCYAADASSVVVDEKFETEMLVWAHHKELDYCPSIHMPRWASRITLEIVNVRVKRVQDISEKDAIAEGAPPIFASRSGDTLGGVPVTFSNVRMEWFRPLWNRLNAKRGFGWDVNPWVWVIEFRRITP